jgi:hypothetical protein
MATGGNVPQDPGPSTTPETQPGAGRGPGRRRGRGEPAQNMLPGRQRRRLGIERMLVRLVATGGVIGVGVALGAILRSNHSIQGWVIGLVVSLVTVILSAILWSSRQL